MNFCVKQFVLFCALFVISSPRAYPLPLEYLFSLVKIPPHAVIFVFSVNAPTKTCLLITIISEY